MPYSGDDFIFVASATPDRPWYYLVHPNPLHHLYRPLTAALISVSTAIAGLATWPVHLANISVHLALCLLVGHVVRRLGFTPLEAMLAALYMGVAQVTTISVSSNDGFQQIAVTLFGSASLWLLWVGLTSSQGLRLVGALGLFAAALIAKESGIAYVAAAGLLCVLAGTRAAQTGYTRIAITFVAFVAIAIVWLVWRAHLGLAEPNWKGSSRYSFQIGFGVLQNMAMMAAAAFVPLSSSDLYLAVVDRQWPFVVLSGVATITVVLMLARGLIRMRWGLVATLALLAVILMFPHVLLVHVSEMYVYSSMPFLAALAGIAFGALDWHRTLRGKAIWLITVALVFALNIQALISKTHQLRVVGEQAEHLTGEIVPIVRSVPQGTLVLLANEARPPEYSVFVAHGFSPLQNGEMVIPYLARRRDVTVKVVDIGDLKREPCPSVIIVQRLGRLQILPKTACNAL